MERKQIKIKNWTEDIENIKDLDYYYAESRLALEFFGISISKDIVTVPKDFNYDVNIAFMAEYAEYAEDGGICNEELKRYLEHIDYDSLGDDASFDYYGSYVDAVLELIHLNDTEQKQVEIKQIKIKKWYAGIKNISVLRQMAEVSEKPLKFFGISLLEDEIILVKEFKFNEYKQLISEYFEYIKLEDACELSDEENDKFDEFLNTCSQKLSNYLEYIDINNLTDYEKQNYYGMFILSIILLIEENLKQE